MEETAMFVFLQDIPICLTGVNPVTVNGDAWYPVKVPFQMCLADICAPHPGLFALLVCLLVSLGQLPPAAMKLDLNQCRKGQNLAFSLYIERKS